jgi:glutamate-ammonia-ligase adenylyltransferase
VTAIAETVDRLLPQLPDPRTAQLLFDRLISENGSLERTFESDLGLLSDVLTIAAWSPLLATTLENNPQYVAWLQRERRVTRVRTREELGESLGRFALVNSQLNPHVMLARFRRRELLRIYLHDIRRTHTIVETTDEISSLADSILEYALKLCRQELDNRYGAPQSIDTQSRISGADFCIVALGKLGSCELNYASDIDLMFLFSEDGRTAVGGSRGQISNREYFGKLAQRLLRLIAESTGEGASYRIDVRLRPHGRHGALACSLVETLSYYESTAQDWELQALIRSRAAAGSKDLFAHFVESVEHRVYRSGISVADALENVRTAKSKIDIQRERSQKGFNVKLGHGGIREIEFIAQALQLAFGGDDAWLRTAHTLITLGRLAERDLISEREHSQLSDAYRFLRTLEHRLQMEHGLQTHTLPSEPSRRELIAKRMNFAGAEALAQFEAALTLHTENVHAVFARVFGGTVTGGMPTPRPALVSDTPLDRVFEVAAMAARVFTGHSRNEGDEYAVTRTSELFELEIAACANVQRALSSLERIASAFDKDIGTQPVNEHRLATLVRLIGASEFFAEIISGRPSLIHALPVSGRPTVPHDYAKELTDAIVAQNCFADELAALRLKWSELLIEIGAHDATNALDRAEVNRLLTKLASGAVDAGLLLAKREFERHHEALLEKPRVAMLGLGRLGSGGMDYGSDLDLIVVYEPAMPNLVNGLTQEQVYARLIEYFVSALSSVTREGVLYRVDLRLRPDGQKGPLAISSTAFLNYIEKRASIWEWLAYVKLRAAAGELEFGREIETKARARIYEAAGAIDVHQLAAETRRVRDRLQKAKAPRRHAGLNIKHGIGGMLDVYFAVRYLQLRDNVPDDGEDRTTRGMLERLRDAGSMDKEDFQRMFAGYGLLRSVDHQLRLIIGRSAIVPSADAPAFADIAYRLGYPTAEQLHNDLIVQMKHIRRSYDCIVST